MMVLNHVSRYHVAKFALEAGRKFNPAVDAVADELLARLDQQLEDFWKYIKETGKGE
jgi:xylulose-5-phosphate/fructose-6-phosphate phosphoketolase